VSDTSHAKPVRWLYAVTAAAAVLGTGLPQLTPDRFDWIGAAIGLGGLAVAAGVAKWTENRVTPNENVEARILPPREEGLPAMIVAGEGSSIPTGAPVDVTRTTDTNWVP
jgi:hypothetical protein